MAFSYHDAAFIGVLLSQLFMGVYITVFGLYVSIVRVKKRRLGAVDFGLIFLFLLCIVTVVLDATQQFYTLMRGGTSFNSKINSVTSTLSITLDFVSQVILIYRCWNVWARNFWVAALPGLIAAASYTTGLAVTLDFASVQDSHLGATKPWWIPLGVVSMALSLVVNALVSALMISKILEVYTEARAAFELTSNSLAWVASVLLESAIALFIAQLVYLVLYKISHPAFALVAGPVTILYGLNCTAIMVRVGMNHSHATMRVATSHSAIIFNSSPPKAFESIALVQSGTATQVSSGTSQGAKPRFDILEESQNDLIKAATLPHV